MKIKVKDPRITITDGIVAGLKGINNALDKVEKFEDKLNENRPHKYTIVPTILFWVFICFLVWLLPYLKPIIFGG